MLKETQAELQQHVLPFGYDLHFVDVNLNYDSDPFVDPFLFGAMLHELEECSRTSDACYFLVCLFVTREFKQTIKSV